MDEWVRVGVGTRTRLRLLGSHFLHFILSNIFIKSVYMFPSEEEESESEIMREVAVMRS